MSMLHGGVTKKRENPCDAEAYGLLGKEIHTAKFHDLGATGTVGDYTNSLVSQIKHTF